MTSLPATVELCQRIRDGLPCLGRIHRSGVPEVAGCTACGKRDAGAIYALVPVILDQAAKVVEEWFERELSRESIVADMEPDTDKIAAAIRSIKP